MYGEDMSAFMKVRDESDPEGMFLGEWHRRTLPLNMEGTGRGLPGKGGLSLMEEEVRRSKKGLGWGFGDGLLWEGRRVGGAQADDDDAEFSNDDANAGDDTPSPPATTTSEESFDYMAKGEASVYAEKREE